MEKRFANTIVIDNSHSIETMLEYLASIQVIAPNPEEVCDYLSHYPDIIELVMLACEETRSRFSLPTQLSLELYRDPEIDDKYLTLYVLQSKYEDNFLDKIEDIRFPYSDELVDKKGYFLLT
ncbi:MAG: hypothetical protein QG641_765, partial [Candidatus Poribacteria bacterium]|nr:hypothetical protein [Candidatus Poribacteria bacterium]